MKIIPFAYTAVGGPVDLDTWGQLVQLAESLSKKGYRLKTYLTNDRTAPSAFIWGHGEGPRDILTPTDPNLFRSVRFVVYVGARPGPHVRVPTYEIGNFNGRRIVSERFL